MCIEIKRKNGNHGDICDSITYLSHPNNEKRPLGLHASYHWEVIVYLGISTAGDYLTCQTSVSSWLQQLDYLQILLINVHMEAIT